VIGVAGAKDPLQQFDAEGLDFINVLGAGEPAVGRSDVALGRALPDLRRQQVAHGRAHRRLGCQQVQAFVAPPPGVAGHGVDDGLLHVTRTGGAVEQIAGPGQHRRIVNFN
jgi:hypothetical protein